MSRLQKAILWVAAVLCVLRVIQNPTIVDALLDFYALGAVPGTDIVLSPDASLWLMVIALALGALGIFLRKIAPGLVRPKKSDTRTPARNQRVRAWLVTANTALHTRFAWLQGRYAAYVPAFTARLHWVAPMVRRVGTVARQYVIAAWRRLYPAVLRCLVWVVVLGQQAWQRVEPHIRMFDKQLETTLNANRYSARLIQFGRDTAVFLQDSWKKAADMSGDFQMRNRQ